MNFKKVLALCVVMVLAIGIISGCAAPKVNEKAPPAGGTDTTATKKDDVKKKIALKLGHGQPAESSAHQSLLKFSKEVADDTKGDIDVQLFPSNQLGNERDLAEGLSMGTIDMSWISVGVMENFETMFAVFSLPYVFKDYEHVHKMAEGDAGKKIFDSLRNGKGIRTLAFFDQGFRFVWNNKQPITKIEDIKGMKIRAPESPVYVGTFKSLGANPSPIPWGEVYTSMQTKVVEGFEVFPESVVTNKLSEVTKYGSMTRHIYAGSVLLINEKIYSSLSDENKKIIETRAMDSEKYNRGLIISNEEKFVAQLESEGMIINDIDANEIEKFSQAVEPLYKEYAQKVGGIEFINEIKGIAK